MQKVLAIAMYPKNHIECTTFCRTKHSFQQRNAPANNMPSAGIARRGGLERAMPTLERRTARKASTTCAPIPAPDIASEYPAVSSMEEVRYLGKSRSD